MAAVAAADTVSVYVHYTDYWYCTRRCRKGEVLLEGKGDERHSNDEWVQQIERTTTERVRVKHQAIRNDLQHSCDCSCIT